MRIAELSRLSGVTPATIKYYLREGLLAPGVHTHPNQVEYTEHHVTRLRLIRALIEIGGLSVSATSDLLSVLDFALIVINGLALRVVGGGPVDIEAIVTLVNDGVLPHAER